MSVFVNRRRLLGTIERHRDVWQYEDSRLVVNRSMAFRHLEYTNITAELFARSFFVIRWTPDGEMARWSYSHYAGKMYRTLTSMVRTLVKGIPPRGQTARNIRSTSNLHIPMEQAFDERTLQHILAATLTQGEGTPGAFGYGWMNFLSIPDSVIDFVESQVNEAIGSVSQEMPVHTEELFGLDEESNEILQSVLDDPEDNEATLPTPTGPVRIIRL